MTASKKMKGLLVNSITEPCGLICCAFGLNTSVAQIYLELEETPITVEDLAEKVGKERSVVQRYLQELVLDDDAIAEGKIPLAIKEAVSLERGGYYYVYKRNSSEAVRKEILRQLDEWYSETRKYLLQTWPEPAQLQT